MGLQKLTKTKNPQIYNVCFNTSGVDVNLKEMRLQSKNLKGKWISLKYPVEMRVIEKKKRSKKK